MNFEVSSKNIFFHGNSEYQLPPLTDHIFSILNWTQQKQQPILVEQKIHCTYFGNLAETSFEICERKRIDTELDRWAE